jgi:hypothetical protein
MSRDSRLQRTIRRAVDRRLEEARKRQKSPHAKLALKIAATLIGIAGSAASILSFLPRLSISPQPPLISSNAFSAPFIVSNDSSFSLYKVNAVCAPEGVVYVEPGHPKHGFDFEQEGSDEDETGGLLNENLEVAELLPAHKNPFPCALLDLKSAVPPEWLVSAQILIIVRYHTLLLPFFQRYYRQRFELTRDSSGQYHWIEQPFKVKAN